MNTITKPRPKAAPSRPARPKPKPNIQPTEMVTAILIRELPWHQAPNGLEHEVKETRVLVPIKYSLNQVIDSIESNINNLTWQVQSIDRPSTKGGYDDEP